MLLDKKHRRRAGDRDVNWSSMGNLYFVLETLNRSPKAAEINPNGVWLYSHEADSNLESISSCLPSNQHIIIRANNVGIPCGRFHDNNQEVPQVDEDCHHRHS
jgi:hypothetical protein